MSTVSSATPPVDDPIGLGSATFTIGNGKVKTSPHSPSVRRAYGAIPEQAPLAVKIALYRIVEEALTSASQRAGGANQALTVEGQGSVLHIEISDDGRVSTQLKWASSRAILSFKRCGIVRKAWVARADRVNSGTRHPCRRYPAAPSARTLPRGRVIP